MTRVWWFIIGVIVGAFLSSLIMGFVVLATKDSQHWFARMVRAGTGNTHVD